LFNKKLINKGLIKITYSFNMLCFKKNNLIKGYKMNNEILSYVALFTTTTISIIATISTVTIVLSN